MIPDNGRASGKIKNDVDFIGQLLVTGKTPVDKNFGGWGLSLDPRMKSEETLPKNVSGRVAGVSN
jgi:hypothetical protein